MAKVLKESMYTHYYTSCMVHAVNCYQALSRRHLGNLIERLNGSEYKELAEQIKNALGL